MSKYGTSLMELSFFYYIMLLSELGTEPTKNVHTHLRVPIGHILRKQSKDFGSLSKFFFKE